MHKVFLANRGNISYGQDPNKSIYGTQSDFHIEIEHPIDAPTVVRQYIVNFDLGASSFVGGQIINENEEMVGYVSYNGRLWDKTSEYFNSNQKIYNNLIKN
jgi:hypothetical protein